MVRLRPSRKDPGGGAPIACTSGWDVPVNGATAPSVVSARGIGQRGLGRAGCGDLTALARSASSRLKRSGASQNGM
jgi:hypothetical protein